MIVEWLPFTLPHDLATQHTTLAGENEAAVVLSRSADLSLAVEITTGVVGREPNPPAGTVSLGATIPARTETGLSVSLHGFRATNHRWVHEANGRARTHISGAVDSVDIEFRDGAPHSLTEWLSNLPSRLWSRSTDRITHVSASRSRGERVVDDASRTGGGSWDYAELALGHPKVSALHIGRVAPEHVTEGVLVDGPGFLEFFAGAEGLPDEQLRHSVKRALEFAFGCGLGTLGTTECGLDGRPLRATASSARVAGGERPPLPPSLWHSEHLDGIDEPVLSKFVTKYLELESRYDLNRVVWLFLHARAAPLDMGSGYLGAAFEILQRNYYDQPQNDARRKLFAPNEWKVLSAALTGAIDDAALRGGFKEPASRVAEFKNRLGGQNTRSLTRMNQQLLDDLQLTHGDVEEAALRSRNNAAHGNELDSEDFLPTLQAYHGLSTLVARVVFAILGVDVQYIDYSTLGHPARPLGDAQGAS